MGGDFNEEFGAPPWEGAGTAARGEGLPAVSRPPHKQDPAQNSSGKGKVDWLFVSGAPLGHDAATEAAILRSHAPCAETGEWPSDHGIEAVAIWPPSG